MILHKSPQLVIFGAGGFLGKSLVSYAQYLYSDIICISRSFCWSEPNNSLKNKLKLIECEIAEVQQYSYLLKSGFVAIFMAGSTSLSQAQITGANDYCNHFKTLLPLFDFFNNASKLFFISSGGTVYGESTGAASKESDRPSPISIYGYRNLILEQIIESLCPIIGVSYCILRLANPFGSEQLNLMRKGLICSLINSCLTGEVVCLRGKGLQERDYVHVDDFSELLISLIALDVTSIPCILNICSGYSLSGASVVELVTANMGKSPNIIVSDESSPFDVQCSRLDDSLLREVLCKIEKPYLFKPLGESITRLSTACLRNDA